jgi:hypothetical protein
VKEERELWVPVHRLLTVLEHNRTRSAEMKPATARKLSGLRAGEQQFMSLTAVDKILCDLGLTQWFHVSEEQGGLADIYEDGLQYGHPSDLRAYRWLPADLRAA